jgi:hypothetical protein
MKATTIKLDGELLSAIERAKPAGQSVTAYVRTILKKSLEQHEVREAAAAYRAFVESHPEERDWLDEWERADLTSPPSEKRNGP